MGKTVIAGNWKMNKTNQEALNLVQTIKAGVYKVTDCDVVVFPPYTALSAVAEAVAGSNIELGAQNMYPKAEGAFTGEISPDMLKALNCRYVILGHSERRQFFHETDAFINEKLKLALKYSLIPIVCVGENLDEREARQFFEVVKGQFEGSLKDISEDEMPRIIIAYEPVWAIGTGHTASPEQAEQMHSYIRRLLNERYGNEVASKVSILYGGSVKPDNTSALMRKPNVDGALVGGASLKAESFTQIVLNAVQETHAKAES